MNPNETSEAFRARAGAAPLKRGVSTGKSGTFKIIPRPRGRGPVEAGSLAAPLVLASSFRARAGAAPLKQQFCFQLRIEYFHSAPARARPR